MHLIDSSVDPIMNPTLFIGSFELREPLTTLTDVVVSLVCIYAYIRFLKYKGAKSEGFKFFKIFFLVFGIGMMCAALFGHGLVAYFSPDTKAIGWALNSFAQILLGLGVLKEMEPVMKPSILRSVKIFFILQVSVFVFLIINPWTRNFIYVQLCSVISLIALVLPLQIFHYAKTKSKASMFFIISILTGLLTSVVFNLKTGFGVWFNHHDISHIILAFMMYFMYTGASRFAFISKNEANEFHAPLQV